MADTPPPPHTKKTQNKSAPSLRWGILRDAFLRRTTTSDGISRKTAQGGFNLIPSQSHHRVINNNNKFDDDDDDDVCVSYTLPTQAAPTLVLRQRLDTIVNLKDFRICNNHDIDNTGLVCQWPAEDVLAFFCLSHADMFRSKRVLELGAGYGFAGLVIAASTDALEVVISDGNPQVVDYIQRNIDANTGAFSGTTVKAMSLHWNQEDVSNTAKTYDIIVASDCTFFKEFHDGLARTVKSLLKPLEGSEAIFFCPRRGDSLDKFVEKIREVGLHCSITENYDQEVWLRHQNFLNGSVLWSNYAMEHCYPLLVRIIP